MADTRRGGIRRGTADGLITATAKANGMRVATRDTAAFEAAGVAVINPWDA